MADSKAASVKNIASMKKSITMGAAKEKQHANSTAQVIEKSSAVIKIELKKLKENIISLLFPAPSPEQTPEQKPGIGDTIKAAGESTAQAGLSIAKLALLIPLLMNDKVKALVGGFFEKFLSNLGVAKPIVDAVLLAVQNLDKILITYFGFKVFQSVKGAFDSIMELARVTGLVAESTNEQASSIDTEKKELRDKQSRLRDEKGKFVKEKKDLEEGLGKASDKAKSGIKDAKKDMKEAKKLGKFSFLKKFKVLKDKIIPKLISLGKNFLKAIPGVGTLLSLGLILYDLWSIGSDIYDVFTGDDDEGKKEVKPEPKKSAAPSNATTQQRVSAAPAAATAAGKKSSAPAAASGKPAAAGNSTAPATPTKAASAGSSSSPSATLETSTPSSAAEPIAQSSEDVAFKDEMTNVQQVSITNINNSKNITMASPGKQGLPSTTSAPTFCILN
jgi:hypothetical protein